MSVMSKKGPDIFCKAPGESVLLEKSPGRKKGYCCSYEYPKNHDLGSLPCPRWAVQSRRGVLLGYPCKSTAAAKPLLCALFCTSLRCVLLGLHT